MSFFILFYFVLSKVTDGGIMHHISNDAIYIVDVMHDDECLGCSVQEVAVT